MTFTKKARTDANQTEIVKGLRKAGCSVLIISALKNCFDIVVGVDGVNYNFEIKDGAKIPSKRKLTPGEESFHENWCGQLDVVLSLEEALKIVGKI